MPWKVGRDRGVGAWENRGREKKGREAGSLRSQEAGEKFKKASFHYLVLLIIQSKKQTQQLFLDFHLTFSEAESKILFAKKVKKQNFVCKNSQEAKIRTRDKKKKQHYFKWMETFPSCLHHRAWMRWNDTCASVSTVSVVSVSPLSH